MGYNLNIGLCYGITLPLDVKLQQLRQQDIWKFIHKINELYPMEQAVISNPTALLIPVIEPLELTSPQMHKRSSGFDSSDYASWECFYRISNENYQKLYTYINTLITNDTSEIFLNKSYYFHDVDVQAFIDKRPKNAELYYYQSFSF
jgi:hypothetical protein